MVSAILEQAPPGNLDLAQRTAASDRKCRNPAGPEPGLAVALLPMAKRPLHPHDPRNLIAEAFRIEGIGAEDCRSIFFDWALGLPAETDAAAAATALLAEYRDAPEDHPMRALLQAAREGALTTAGRRRRRNQRRD
ncbi:MAG: hypothetical protein AAF713_04380 [Pseudomonadota bacterium]